MTTLSTPHQEALGLLIRVREEAAAETYLDPLDLVAEAQLLATLALVEEQRTANLIARAAFMPPAPRDRTLDLVDARLGL